MESDRGHWREGCGMALVVDDRVRSVSARRVYAEEMESSSGPVKRTSTRGGSPKEAGTAALEHVIAWKRVAHARSDLRSARQASAGPRERARCVAGRSGGFARRNATGQEGGGRSEPSASQAVG